ncbi:hypothetical protein NBRC116493_29900 [Aurantivibrio infirmus]
MKTVVSLIDGISERTGTLVAWLCILMLLLMVSVVAVHGLQLNSNGLKEAVIYLHSTVFLLGAAYTLKADGHVRVDIFYRRYSLRTKAWVNSIGHIVFLLPFCVFIFFISWDLVSTSWRVLEVSNEPGGLPAVFVLKTLIPVAAFSLALQGIAEILRSLILLLTLQSDEKL